MPYIDTYRSRLDDRHYINDATTSNHWLDINRKKYNTFLEMYGEDFCLVYICSHPPRGFDDAYVFPVRDFRNFFSPGYLRDDYRWMATIQDDELVLSRPGLHSVRKPVREYHNAYGLLQDAPPYVREKSVFDE
jgi:hypothetical protein